MPKMSQQEGGTDNLELHGSNFKEIVGIDPAGSGD
jgi:hypothetical protein